MCARHKKMHPPTGPKTEEGKQRIRDATSVGKHGIYAAAWSEEEQAMAEEMSTAELRTHELVNTRIQLLRVSRLIQTLRSGQRVVNGSDESTEADNVPIGPNGQPEGRPRSMKVVRKTSNMSMTDALMLYDRLVSRVLSLQKEIREAAMLPALSDSPDQQVERIKTAVQGAISLTGGEEGEAAYVEDTAPTEAQP